MAVPVVAALPTRVTQTTMEVPVPVVATGSRPRLALPVGRARVAAAQSFNSRPEITKVGFEACRFPE